MRNPSAGVDGASNFWWDLGRRKLEGKEKSIKKHLKQASKKKDMIILAIQRISTLYFSLVIQWIF
jgi:hypothetical protein